MKDIGESQEKWRRKEEQIAYKINDKLGSIVEKKNNFEIAVDNFMESNPYPIIKRIIEISDKLNVGDHIYIQYPLLTHHELYCYKNIF